MLASQDHVAFRNRTRDASMSPSYRAHHSTPPRLTSDSAPSYDSPMLTPSPLRLRSALPNYSVGRENDADDIFLQSPFRSPAPPHPFHASFLKKPQPIDDDDGAIFLGSSSATPFSPFSPPSSSQILRTPVKQVHRVPSRSALAVKSMNALPRSTASSPVPLSASRPTARTGVGTKRKSTPLATTFSTPLRQHTLTPLHISSTQNASGDAVFDKLAPLPAPRFTAQTPQTRAETEVHLKSQTASLTKLRITDFNHSGDEFVGLDDDSGLRDDDDDGGNALFLRHAKRVAGVGRVTHRKLAGKAKFQDEVAEAISPGGHITKRRARSRPVSLELLETVARSPSPSPTQMSNSRSTGAIKPTNKVGGVVFPSSKIRTRNSSSSSSESGSPFPRRRVSGGIRPHPPSSNMRPTVPPARAPLTRMESTSSATLFFGPAIAPPPQRNINPRRRTSTTSSSTAASNATMATNLFADKPSLTNRHSFAGSLSWNTLRNRSPSPQSSPLSLPQHSTPVCALDSEEDEEDAFFGSKPQNTSFMFSITEGTPSPRAKRVSETVLPKKYKPRDSGVMMSDDDEMSFGASHGSASEHLSAMPRASTSVGSVCSDPDDGLITPIFGPASGSMWPESAIIASTSGDVGEKSLNGDLGVAEGGVDVDAFILRTLAAGTKPSHDDIKKVPGTPVKKMKTSYLIGDRPWQSAVATKVGFNFDAASKKSRPSLPAAFPTVMTRKGRKASLDTGSDSEEETEDSPSGRNKYVGVGLGRPSFPSVVKDGISAVHRTRWLMRRSSSGNFSSGSEAGTPTRSNSKDWNLPPPRTLTLFSPSKTSFKLSPLRSTSGSSSSSGTVTMYSPTLGSKNLPRILTPRASSAVRRQTEPSAQEQPGRFERDFVAVDEVGSGQFGQVIKVRRQGEGGEVFAVKKSKRFEGMRHRLRLREEVEILQHLSQAASLYNGSRHPNVLAYIDSWEQDEALYIRTELCELGNFAHFLWEYGRVFPRLDEARVWKIIVDLSNGLEFIHDAGVIHLDLKPANIFVTGEGRFKIGDFGMASLWPRPAVTDAGSGHEGGFEREGDKVYLAPEVLQGKYGFAADIFSFGMTMLETASNIVVPDQGEPWQRLRQEDFSQVDLEGSPELFSMIQGMMRTDPALRTDVHSICRHPIVSRARCAMERLYEEAKASGSSIFCASPLAGVSPEFLEEILGRRVQDDGAMDLCL